MKKEKIYALYKGDEFIDLGTKEYLAKLINVKKRTIDFYSQKTYAERNKGGNCYIVIRCDEEVED